MLYPRSVQKTKQGFFVRKKLLQKHFVFKRRKKAHTNFVTLLSCKAPFLLEQIFLLRFVIRSFFYLIWPKRGTLTFTKLESPLQ